MQKKIVRRQAQTDLAATETELHPIMQQIFAKRGVHSVAELERGLANLIPYQQLLGIDKAVDLLFTAMQRQEHIMIIGDFDADGATSSAVAVSALRAFGVKNVDFLVPNRFEYGYGLTPEIVAVAAEKAPNLLITVDNGISSCQGVDAAKERGYQVLITDHHLAGKTLPAADAIVNPNQPDCPFPSKNLAGVGVIFYVMLALRAHLRAENWFAKQKLSEPNMGDLLDFVALGTVADLVPLDKNNRILVYQGLQRMRSGQCRPGLRALLDVAGRDAANLTAQDLGFAVAPRLNAAGRLDDMSLGIACLLAENLNQANKIAMQLDALNKERKLIEDDMQRQAFSAIDKLHLDPKQDMPLGLCLFDKTWHQGVIGIVASRVKEKLHRPVIAFAPVDAQIIKGSARSIKGVHIRDVLDRIATQHPDLIEKFGGHAMAAGLSLRCDHYSDFAKAFAAEVKTALRGSPLQHEILSDGELALPDISMPLAQVIRESGPWGQAFPEPLFDGKFKLIQQRLVGGKHLKLVLSADDQTKMLDAIAFNVDPDQWPNHRCEYVTAAYRLDINHFRGMRNLQLVIEHLEAAEVC